MALFKRQADSNLPPPPLQTGNALMDEVQRLLDQIGGSRLKVHDPRVKVLLTQIAQNGEYRLTAGSDEPPSDVVLVEFRSHLESVMRVVSQLVDFQDNAARYPNVEEMAVKARQAVEGFAAYVLRKDIPGGSRNLTDFKVDTDILAAKQYR